MERTREGAAVAFYCIAWALTGNRQIGSPPSDSLRLAGWNVKNWRVESQLRGRS